MVTGRDDIHAEAEARQMPTFDYLLLKLDEANATIGQKNIQITNLKAVLVAVRDEKGALRMQVAELEHQLADQGDEDQATIDRLTAGNERLLHERDDALNTLQFVEAQARATAMVPPKGLDATTDADVVRFLLFNEHVQELVAPFRNRAAREDLAHELIDQLSAIDESATEAGE